MQALRKNWCYLVDAFKTHKIEFTVSLSNFQTVFESLKIELG